MSRPKDSPPTDADFADERVARWREQFIVTCAEMLSGREAGEAFFKDRYMTNGRQLLYGDMADDEPAAAVARELVLFQQALDGAIQDVHGAPPCKPL